MGSLLALSTSHSLRPSLFVYGRQSPVRQTELIIGIRDVHGAGFRSTLGWKDTARCGGSGSETAGVCPR